MIRLTKKYLGVALAIALTVAVIAAVVWVAATTQGARWLLTTAVPLSGVSVSAQKIQGSISDRLLLKGVRVGLAQQKVEIDRLELRWKPLLLLSGTVAIQDLILNGVRIQDDAPPDNKPLNLAWPRVSETGQLFDGRIARLKVTNLSYRSLQEQPLLVTSIAGSLTWQDSILSVQELTVLSPSGRIRGSVSAGFGQPSLTSDLAIDLAQPLAEMDRFTLLARQSKETGKEPFVGYLAITGSAGTRKLLELSGDVGMAKDAVNLRRLTLTRPGQKRRITADGSLSFKTVESLLSLQVKADGLDLAPDLNVPTDLSGTLRFAGTLNSYHGDFTFANRARNWQAATVSASYQGTRKGMKLAPMNAKLLDGTLAGNLDMNWNKGFSLQGVLSGTGLNPARLDPAWKGVANFKVKGSLTRIGTAPLTGNISGALLESRLHGQALTGEVQADFKGDNISLARLALQGKGFNLLASGELDQRITLAATVSDFSLLIPGSAGTLRTDGWMRWRDKQLSGAVTGSGNSLAYSGTRVAAGNLTARLEQGPGYPLHVTAALKDVIYDAYMLDALTLEADGTLQHHTVSATVHAGKSDARLTLNAGYNDRIWKGEISRLAGRDSSGPWNLTAPASFAVSSDTCSLSPLALSAGTAERLEVAADLKLNPLGGQVRSQWSGLNLARANAYLKDMQLKGSSSGTARIGFQSGKLLSLAGNANASGTFTGQVGSMTLQRSQVTFEGSATGMRIGVDLATADSGRLKGTFSSTAPLSLSMPEKGDLTLELNGIDPALFKPWLPTETRLEGRISGHAKGILLPGKRFELDGTARLSGGTLHQQRPDGELNLAFTSTTAAWGWRGETLSGNLALVMTQYGQARGTFQLPLAARFPLAFNPNGPLRGTLVGQVQEKGMITTLFPELIQESSGVLDADLAVNGTWAVPQVGGKLRLTNVAAYLPTAGIHLKDVQLAARLEKNLMRVESFRAISGPGHLEGTALITLDGWRVTHYKGTISGDRFQTVNFPELQILSTPKLSFEGTPQKLTLRGDLQLPELKLVGSQSRTVVTPSSDVVREGVVVPVTQSSPLALDVQVRVMLGDKVQVKVAGIDAQLGGAIDLSMSRLDRISSKGEIKVIKGHYRTYGVNLEIVRGRLFFAGGTIDLPSIDVLALRTIGNIRAGVTVTGTLQRPITKLYSEPAMPDVDVLAYIILGHPLGSSGQQASLLTQAAGALLTSGQAVVLQEKIKNQLGLSTLEIQEGVGATSGAMGYKPLQVTAPGAIPAAQQAGVTETVLTVGKYLTPQLYISYGKSLFTGSNLFKLRYDIFKHWQIETQTGSGESGADLYYKLEFM
jgi:translocation and assembly module TamB